jgi:hypothetical protein
MSEFTKTRESPDANWAAVQQLAQAYLETINLRPVMTVQQRLLELANTLVQKDLITKLEIWNVKPNLIEGAWRFVLYNEDTAIQIEALQA